MEINMETRKRCKDMYEAAWRKTQEYINVGKMCKYLYEHAYEIVGEDGKGYPTTLMNEVGEVARLAHKAYVASAVNLYNARKAYEAAELTDEEKERHSERQYNTAAKKICFLNTVAKAMGVDGFLAKKIDRNSPVDRRELVDAFEWVVTHYEDAQKRM